MTPREAYGDDPDFDDVEEADASAIPEGETDLEDEAFDFENDVDGDEDDDDDVDAEQEAVTAEEDVDPDREVYRGRPAWLNYWRSFLLGAAPVVAGIVLWEKNGWFLFGGLIFALVVYSYICVSRAMYLYVVTPRRVEIIFGLITKNSNEVRVRDIRAINVKKTGLKGFIGVGTVEFASAGGSDVEVAFKDIWKPRRVKGLVRALQDGEA